MKTFYLLMIIAGLLLVLGAAIVRRDAKSGAPVQTSGTAAPGAAPDHAAADAKAVAASAAPVNNGRAAAPAPSFDGGAVPPAPPSRKGTETVVNAENSGKMMNEREAIAAARKACEKLINIPADAPVKVSLKDGRYEVIFVQVLPPGVRGGDYHAKVILDASTGKVIQLLAGS